MSRPFYFFIEGIENDTRDVKGWHLRAERWVENRLRVPADSIPYRVRFWNRWLYQKGIIDNAFACLTDSLGPPDPTPDDARPWSQLRIACHSNGAPVALEMLRKNPAAHCHTLDLIAGAADADCAANGVNIVAERGQVGRIRIWVSDADDVLSGWAKWSKRLFGWAGLGYGSLGYEGPRNLSSRAAAITTVVPRNGFGHGTYFNDPHYEQTMRTITDTLGDPPPSQLPAPAARAENVG